MDRGHKHLFSSSSNTRLERLLSRNAVRACAGKTIKKPKNNLQGLYLRGIWKGGGVLCLTACL